MNIWFAADININSPGGVARSMIELANGLKKRGHSIKIVSKNELPSSNYLFFSLKLSILFLKKIFNPPNWIIARSTDALFCLLFIKLLKSKTKVILHNHGWEENVYEIEKKMSRFGVTNKTTWKARIVRFPLLRLTLKLCNYCLNVNFHETKYIGKRYPHSKNKLLSIQNGVHNRKNIYWQNQSEMNPNFLSVGNTSWKKNLNHTLQIFYYLKMEYINSKIFTVGTGVDIDSLFKNKGENMNGVTNVPTVEYGDMNKWYTSCPYMIVSSRFEGCSLSILEALSFGIIVFASGIESNKEIITNGYNGFLISCSDYKSDSEIIINTLKENKNLHEIRKNAAETANKFSWSKQVIKLENILCIK